MYVRRSIVGYVCENGGSLRRGLGGCIGRRTQRVGGNTGKVGKHDHDDARAPTNDTQHGEERRIGAAERRHHANRGHTRRASISDSPRTGLFNSCELGFRHGRGSLPMTLTMRTAKTIVTGREASTTDTYHQRTTSERGPPKGGRDRDASDHASHAAAPTHETEAHKETSTT